VLKEVKEKVEELKKIAEEPRRTRRRRNEERIARK
jgi:hypothetical protein